MGNYSDLTEKMKEKYNRKFFQNNRSKNYFIVLEVFPFYDIKTDEMLVCYHLKQYNKKRFKYVFQDELDKNYTFFGNWMEVALKMKENTITIS
jgi:hypothetical protein